MALEGENNSHMLVQNRNILISFLIFFVIFSIEGCVSYSSDVSNHREWWGGYEYKQEYVLLNNVFLLTDDTKKFFLVPDRSVLKNAGIKSTPKSIEEYRNSPNQIGKNFEDKWKDTKSNRVIGVVDAGTRIKCIRLEKLDGISIWWGFVSGLDIYAEILDGQFANYEVNVRDVSTFNCFDGNCDNDPILFKPDSRLLK